MLFNKTLIYSAVLDLLKLFSISTRLKAVLGQYELFTDRNTKDHLARIIGNGNHMHGGVYPAQDTSLMGTARVKLKEEADTRVIVE